MSQIDSDDSIIWKTDEEGRAPDEHKINPLDYICWLSIVFWFCFAVLVSGAILLLFVYGR